MKYTRWTDELKEQAQFLLAASRSYKIVAHQLDISESALRNQNNRYWHIDCRMVWTDYNDHILLNFLNNGVGKKEIASLFDTTENAINIRLSQLKKRGDK